MSLLDGKVRARAPIWLLLSVFPRVAAPEGQWEIIAKRSGSEMSIAPSSIVGVSQEVASAWVQHRSTDGFRTLERYEVNCTTQQRRLLEVWHRPDLSDTAPVALAQREEGWTPTERKTTMRKLVVRVCALWNLERD